MDRRTIKRPAGSRAALAEILQAGAAESGGVPGTASALSFSGGVVPAASAAQGDIVTVEDFRPFGLGHPVGYQHVRFAEG